MPSGGELVQSFQLPAGLPRNRRRLHFGGAAGIVPEGGVEGAARAGRSAGRGEAYRPEAAAEFRRLGERHPHSPFGRSRQGLPGHTLRPGSFQGGEPQEKPFPWRQERAEPCADTQYVQGPRNHHVRGPVPPDSGDHGAPCGAVRRGAFPASAMRAGLRERPLSPGSRIGRRLRICVPDAQRRRGVVHLLARERSHRAHRSHQSRLRPLDAGPGAIVRHCQGAQLERTGGSDGRSLPAVHAGDLFPEEIQPRTLRGKGAAQRRVQRIPGKRPYPVPASGRGRSGQDQPALPLDRKPAGGRGGGAHLRRLRVCGIHPGAAAQRDIRPVAPQRHTAVSGQNQYPGQGRRQTGVRVLRRG